MMPFAVLVRSGCSTHANLALALTAEFAALRDDPAQRALDELAIGLLDARDGGAGGDDPARCANRLSVALSTLRGVLDPQRRFGADRFVMSVGAAVALDLEHVAVDLEAFLGAAATGLALREQGRIVEAHEHLVAAEAAYAGDLLEEDLYEDWAVAAREDARDVYVRVARSLAIDARAAGDHDAAVRFLLRVLERDAYDEDAHLGLVATFVDAGRHGEARRAFRTYRARMDQIGVEPASFPAVALPEADTRVVSDAV